ncbi:MAG: DUF4159 domain-containing protein [Alphaproteobacteria bacterium]|nr:DUF4159 domain-containing protein [Alphaproteobacteria bacterium]
MLSLGLLSFAAPWILAGLVALPILWWLLRAVPPAPRRVTFPAIRLLFGLEQREETPHRTPWWLLALRLTLAALVIAAFAHPVINPARELRGSGPLLLVIDNGWAAARDWAARLATAADLLDQAERSDKNVIVLTTAPEAGEPLAASALMRPAEARDHLLTITPKPWTADRKATLSAFDSLNLDGSVNAAWLSNGLRSNVDREAAEDTATTNQAEDDGNLLNRLQASGALQLFAPPDAELPNAITGVENAVDAMVVQVMRPISNTPQTVDVIALAEDGRLLARESARFDQDASSAEVRLVLPSELRNRVARVAISEENTVGATFLVDERFRRRPVGIASGDRSEVDQPLLGDSFYVNRALEPFAELREGTIEELLERELAVLVLADIGTLTRTEQSNLTGWIEGGGVVVRFAGAKLAEGSDDFLPVTLRRGGRIFGGVMSWDRPASLAPFEKDSPFAGLDVSDEIVITRQVLAEPSPTLASKTWGRLNDGTPLVTAEQRGDGWLILFHTTANAEWSTLALSGLYVDMLRRIVGLSQGISSGADAGTLRPHRVLDGFGRFVDPAVTVRPIDTGDAESIRVSPRTPPGLYGPEGNRRAVNLGPEITTLASLEDPASGVFMDTYGPKRQVDLRSWFLTAALALLLIDFLIGLALRGILPFQATRGSTAAVAALAFGIALATGSPDAAAQTSDQFAIEVTDTTRLAYILTGDTKLDETSRAGLIGLGLVLEARTSVVPGEPVGLDVERDELAFFSLLYWPISTAQPALSDEAKTRINSYMRNGGSILFDTRDQQFSTGAGEGAEKLRQLVDGLDIPGLIPVPVSHVLTRSFYLLQDFPGRWDGGTLWVEQPDERVNDGVSSVIVGSNDYAAAWAVDRRGRALFPVIPGGDQQREIARRFGVNLVMYALTGNYKADQVHVDAILERLGQ